MVGKRDIVGHLEESEPALFQDIGAEGGMGLHDLELIGAELPRLKEYIVGDPDLSDIVHGSGVLDELEEVIAQSQVACDYAAVFTDPHDMSAGAVVAAFGCHQEPENHFPVQLVGFFQRLLQVARAPGDGLFQPVLIIFRLKDVPDPEEQFLFQERFADEFVRARL
jgi:hypothetical protein